MIFLLDFFEEDDEEALELLLEEEVFFTYFFLKTLRQIIFMKSVVEIPIVLKMALITNTQMTMTNITRMMM
jgi:hypothetical protein